MNKPLHRRAVPEHLAHLLHDDSQARGLVAGDSSGAALPSTDQDSRADPRLTVAMKCHAPILIADLPAASVLVDTIRRAIRACINDGEPKIDVVATRIGRSRRSVQRELAAVGSSFRQELEQVRTSMALVLLANHSLSILDIAMQLGYAEQSVFSHSFRRWMGVSPTAYRLLSVHTARPRQRTC